MANLSTTLSSTVSQTIGGVIVGSIIDPLFPSSPGLVDGANVLKVSTEIVLQTVVASIATSAFFDFLSRRGYTAGDNDPTKGLAFYITMIACQPNLYMKLVGLSGYAKQWISQVSSINLQMTNQGMKPDSLALNKGARTYGTPDAWAHQSHQGEDE